MIIMHNYSPRYTQKLLKLGMAQEGGELYHIVKECASCFYIDRLPSTHFQ